MIDAARATAMKTQAIDVIDKALNIEGSLTEEQFHAESIRINCAFNVLNTPMFLFGDDEGNTGEPAIQTPAPTDHPPALATA